MTEVAGLPVLSVRHYEAPPPANLNRELVDPENAYATTKEEEWVTKKKVELTTKRQIETRVKRQVVLEDGKVVEDSGPIVTTNTTEDTEKQESKQTEHRNLGEDLPDGGEGWVAVPGQGGLVKEVKEKTTKTREEKEERLETEDVHHLGDITDEAYLTAVQRQSQQGGELRALELVPRGVDDGARIVHQSSKSRKVVDTQDSRHLSELQPDGRVVTETHRTTDHEEVNHVEEPDGEDGPDWEEESHRRGEQRHAKSKDQEFVEYLADGKRIGGEMRYEAETAQGDRQGDVALLDNWDSLSARARRMRRAGAKGLTGTPADRKDALTKRPLDFDQEEETRKAETSKWLEHHFGSESRSSKDSVGDSADESPLPAPGATSSFINVTMKSARYGPVSGRAQVSSPEADSPSPTSYFRGVSEWKSDRPERPARTSFVSHQTSAFKDRVQVLPTGPNHTFTPPKGSPSPPYPASSLGSKNFRGSQGSNLNLNGRASSGPESSLGGRRRPSSPSGSPSPRAVSPPLHRPTANGHSINGHSINGHSSNGHSVNGHSRHIDLLEEQSASPRPHRHLNGHSQRDEREERSRVVREQREYHHHQRMEEPAPDYPRATPSPSPPPPPIAVADPKKKVYQRTRFAADIPPARAKATQTAHKPTLGESFRKFVGKFRSASKEKRRDKKRGSGSRSPSPQAPTYHPYGQPDDEADEEGGPVAPPRGRQHQQQQTTMRRGGDSAVGRYYLGEDPFGGSIYGREKEYDGVAPFRRKHHRDRDRDRAREAEEERNARNQQLTNGNSSTLGRFSKSTSRLISERHTNGHQQDRGGVQTLPRKLHDDRSKKQVYVTRSNVEHVTSPSWERQHYPRLNGHSQPNSHSMINVSVVNRSSPTPPSPAVGPAKPARTYRSLLSRSKSFNVHAGDLSADLNGVHKSNPQLHRLDESPPPLKSPGIVTSISRSTKDLSREPEEEPRFDFDRRPYTNGHTRTAHETKKKIFMRNLQDRAPELFRTLHGEERGSGSPADERRYTTPPPLRNGSYRSSGASSPLDRVHSPAYSHAVTHGPDGEVVNRSVVRRGSGDDYSETVHITSKSEDPLRPSVTDTVQSFSKKTVPGKGGRSRETIESSETKTVTKSRYRGGDRDRDHYDRYRNGGGVTIEVRNNK